MIIVEFHISEFIIRYLYLFYLLLAVNILLWGLVEAYGVLGSVLGGKVLGLYSCRFVWKHFAGGVAFGIVEWLVGMRC